MTFKRFQKQLDDLKAKGRYRSLVSPCGVDLTSNDYLGLRQHPGLRAKAIQFLDDGLEIGAGGSRLLRGQMQAHESLESYAAQFFGSEAALYFATGYQANLALFTTLCGRHDVILYDELIHASARDGIEASHAKGVRISHNDLQAFEDVLKVAREDRRAEGMIWLAVESLYSMDGDYAPVMELYGLAQKYDATLIVDEAHATGVLGDQGRGLAYDVCLSLRAEGEAIQNSAVDCRVGQSPSRNDALPDNIVTLHTCGKALGVAGGLVCAPAAMIDYLVNKARPFIYSTAPMPLQAAMVEEALKLVASEEGAALRRALSSTCDYVKLNIGGEGSHIVPIVIGEDVRATQIAAALQDAGYDIRAIRPPTVAEGTARLRLSLSCALDAEVLNEFFLVLSSLRAEGEAIQNSAVDCRGGLAASSQ